MPNQAFHPAELNDALSRRGLLRLGALTAAGTALAGLPYGRPLLAHDISESWPNVAALAKKYIDEGKVANLLVAFGRGQDDMAHTVGGGTLSLSGTVEVNQDSLYRMYSMTKPITGMCAMTMIDEGLIELDQPIHEFMPAWRDMMVQKEYDGAITEDNLEPANGPVTVRHLLTHTAGIGYTIIQQGPITTAMNEAGLIAGQVSKMPIPGVFQGESVQSLEAYADGMAKIPLVYQPGYKWSYSASLDVLGRVIEVAAGKPFDTVLKERIFDPCGMESTWFTVPQSEIGRLTDNLGILNGAAFPIDPAANSIYLETPPFPAGGAGLVSSPRDYDRFLRMVLGYGKLGDTQVISEAAVRMGVSDLLPEGVITEGTWSEGEGFGAGGRVVNGTFGWGGAAGTLAVADFNHDMRVCLCTQYMPSNAYPIRDEFFAAVLADLAAMQSYQEAA